MVQRVKCFGASMRTPVLSPEIHAKTEMPGVVECTCNLRAREMETGGFLGFFGRQPSLISQLQINELNKQTNKKQTQRMQQIRMGGA